MTGIHRGPTPSSLRSREDPRASTAHLIRHVLERPELLAAVRELPGEALAGLIDRVGLEDAGEIVALASTEQLAQVFDHDLWKAARAGADEDFQPRRFGLWLHVLAEAGDEYLAERLVALPKDLLSLALHRLLLVLDMDALAERWSEPSEELEQTEKALEASLHEEWEEFRLISRHPESWDVLWSALLTLDRDHHGLLRELLECCAALDAEIIEDNGSLYEVLTSEEMLENDVAAERADRRAGAGYVAPSDARAFLALARSERSPAGRDPITRAYFRELAPPHASASSAARGAGPSRALLELTRLLDEPVHRARRPNPRRKLPSARSPGASSSNRGSLSTERATPTRNLLERAVAELRALDPELASTRLEELAYLANVWMAGGSHAGRRPRPVEALEFVSEVCGAALQHGEQQSGATSTPLAELADASRAARVLASTPCDLLFRRGYAARGPARDES
ncbi:MAG TPA: DUF6178 family protein [Polyangiales bacterium]